MEAKDSLVNESPLSSTVQKQFAGFTFTDQHEFMGGKRSHNIKAD